VLESLLEQELELTVQFGTVFLASLVLVKVYWQVAGTASGKPSGTCLNFKFSLVVLVKIQAHLPLAIPTEHVSGANPSLSPGDLAWNAARAQPSMPYEEVASVYRSPIPPTGFPQPNPPDGRIHHPGRDPTRTKPSGCFDLPGP
jgi:hypothetical protein